MHPVGHPLGRRLTQSSCHIFSHLVLPLGCWQAALLHASTAYAMTILPPTQPVLYPAPHHPCLHHTWPSTRAKSSSTRPPAQPGTRWTGKRAHCRHSLAPTQPFPPSPSSRVPSAPGLPLASCHLSSISFPLLLFYLVAHVLTAPQESVWDPVLFFYTLLK